ncbi:hypothetical protein ACH5RR_041235 [Cinchona calisaya]|uniref:Uncharacterized protein n=1 Tax=Cinchona calisaya TaxID=153742 RepID=A0ABD2XUD9_9GENT
MATRYRSLSRSAFSFLKSTSSQPSIRKPNSPSSSVFGSPLRSSPSASLSRPLPQMGCLQSLLPLHTAVSSARLTSCLGLDSKGSRSMSQELGLSVPR